jgi:antitoxin component YwqK of YwqJK toxin-antitoxin module
MVVFNLHSQISIDKSSDSIQQNEYWKTFYYNKKNTKVYSIQCYKNEIKNGNTYIYSRNGSLKGLYYYQNGKMIFTKKYKTKGKNKGKVNRIHGLRINKTESIYKYDFDSSNLSNNSINFTDSNGLKQGIWHQVIITSVFDPGADEYYCVGKFIDGKREGLWKIYYFDEKQLKYEIMYNNNELNGKVVIYYRNGNIAAVRHYENSIKNGEHISLFPNGKPRSKGFYKNGKNIGKYFRFNKSGKLIECILYSE